QPKFELYFRLVDLNNVPLVSGTSSIKWHLAASNAAEHSGKTPKFTIKDHKVVYDYAKTIQLRLVIGKDSVLQDSHLNFDIQQEYQSSGRTERITLGVIKLNLAEYVDTGAADQAEGGNITRRYLMQESKINSTLKIEIAMRHLEGDRNYTCPPLRSAPVFGGIAGIMSSDVAEAQEEGANMPSLSSKSREHGELQDMYRRTLAASWAAAPGEPRADDCIEDIFAGGDGWGGARNNNSSNNNNGNSRATTPTQSRINLGLHDDSDEDNMSRNSSVTNISSVEKLSSGALKSGGVTGRTSLEQSVKRMERAGGIRVNDGSRGHEIDEFNNPFKEDLRSWRVRSAAS
ncbi:hypothetical protein K461DRAFT_227020, partial [Myriangium duriaei CBS 260.36]